MGRHGAGFTNLIGCSPGESFLVEGKSKVRDEDGKRDKKYVEADPPCFEHLAKICKVDYCGIDVSNDVLNIDQLNNELTKIVEYLL